MGPELDALLRNRFAGRIEVVELMPDADVDASLTGDVLLAPGRAGGRPAISWLVDLAGRGVRWIHVAGANVGDLPEEIFAGRTITCSRGAMASPISEFVLASMLAFEKRFPYAWIDRPPALGWDAQSEFEPVAATAAISPDSAPQRWGYADLGTLDGKTLGIFGLGSIGRTTAEKALAFGMRVVAARRSDAPSDLEAIELVGSAHELVERADHVVLTAPSTPATHRLFGDDVLRRAKVGAHLVNVSRGGLVDQEALIRALDSGRLAFASLDVTDPEPLPAGHPLYSHPKVRLTPHISWCSPRKQQRTGEIILENVARYLDEKPLHGYVSPSERY